MNCKKTLVPLLLLSFFSLHQVSAQDDFTQLIESGQQDANTIANGYLGPVLDVLSVGLGSGWMNTAKTHKPAGFDLTITANAIFVPDDELFYNATFENLTINPSPSGLTSAPTAFGTDDPNDIPSYTYDYVEDGVEFNGTFDAPEGLNIAEELPIQALPVPTAQLGIGIIKNTDIKIRWTPRVDLGDNGEGRLLGFGIMHDIKQHIPGIKDLPFDLSAFVGFTDLTAEYDLSAEIEPTDNVITDNGEAIFDVNTWSIQGMISKKFSVLTLYGGLGYNIANAELAMNGDFTVFDDDGDSYETTDPISISSSVSGPRLTAGFMLKLAILTLHADYTLQRFSTLGVGVGFSVR